MTGRSDVFSYKKARNLFSRISVKEQENKPIAQGFIHIWENISGALFKQMLFFGLVSFLLSRAVILDFLNPFNLAFTAALLLTKTNTKEKAVSKADKRTLIVTTVLCAIAGVATLGRGEMLLKCIFTTAVFLLLYSLTIRVKRSRTFVIVAAAVIANLTAGFFVFYVKNYFFYDMLMEVIESVLIGVLILIYARALPIIINYKIRRRVAMEEIAALAVLAAFCFVGADFIIWDLSFKTCCIILLIYLFSYFGNAGSSAAAGIIFGVVQALSGSILPSAIGVYGLCGLMCGILKETGRFGCIIGFIMGNALMTYYINGSTEVLIRFTEILASSAVFMVLPLNSLKKTFAGKGLMSSEDRKEKNQDRWMRERTKERLQEVSEVFNALSGTLKDSALTHEYFSEFDAAQMIDQVVNQNCTSCGLSANCWKRDFYKSYQIFFSLLSSMEAGELNTKNIPAAFKERCLKSEEIILCIKQSFDLYKSSINWKRKMNESRMMIGEQLKEVSSVVSNLALKIDYEVQYKNSVATDALEERIMECLDNEGIGVNAVSIIETDANWEVELSLSGCGGKRSCIKQIIPLINQATGRKFVKQDMSCVIRAGNNCVIRLKEAGTYQIATGVSRICKQGTISGDNHTFMELKDGKFLMALSDGMGSGQKAAKESNTTMMLLEKLLHAGFDRDVAVKTINTLLLLKSTEEMYATIDMTVVDLYSGEVEFVKAGAVSTFIKNEDRVDIIRAGSLPAGILNHIDMEFARKKLRDGSFVVMVTDGILDANQKETDKEAWLAKIIGEADTRNPQKMADQIIEKCLQQSNGIPMDDMTILVAKIWETSSRSGLS